MNRWSTIGASGAQWPLSFFEFFGNRALQVEVGIRSRARDHSDVRHDVHVSRTKQIHELGYAPVGVAHGEERLALYATLHRAADHTV